MTATPDSRAALAHELKTPLAVIIGYADAMIERTFGPLDASYVEGARTIQAAARHLQALIESLTAAPHERFDARSPVAEGIAMFALEAQTRGVSLAADLGETPLQAATDPLALRQILINLVANALAATPKGGEVRVTLGREGGDLVLTVDDTGPGVTAPEGLGLGLVRALCASGRFDLTSRAGGGARAQARLPVIAGA